MGAGAIDLFKTAMAKQWYGERFVAFSFTSAFFTSRLNLDGLWVNSISRSYLLPPRAKMCGSTWISVSNGCSTDNLVCLCFSGFTDFIRAWCINT